VLACQFCCVFRLWVLDGTLWIHDVVLTSEAWRFSGRTQLAGMSWDCFDQWWVHARDGGMVLVCQSCGTIRLRGSLTERFWICAVVSTSDTWRFSGCAQLAMHRFLPLPEGSG
jgi:hypothetical protein